MVDIPKMRKSENDAVARWLFPQYIFRYLLADSTSLENFGSKLVKRKLYADVAACDEALMELKRPNSYSDLKLKRLVVEG